jgi:hypothetical protein
VVNYGIPSIRHFHPGFSGGKMHSNSIDITRRSFLLKSAAVSIGVMNLTAPRAGIAASRDRIIVFQGVGLDSLHPYAYSGGGISGIWQHVIEPLSKWIFPARNMSASSPNRGNFKDANGHST